MILGVFTSASKAHARAHGRPQAVQTQPAVLSATEPILPDVAVWESDQYITEKSC